ncbi:MAG: minor capsid protein [Desulfitobacterium sp.]
MTYWQERQEQRYLAGEKKISAYHSELKKSFEQSKKEIHSVITNFYGRYADENGLTYTEAQKALSKAEIGELKDFIAKVNQHMGEYNQELNNMSIKARITRYQAMEKQIDAILQQLYTIDYELKGEEVLKEVYAESYYQTWFSIDQFHGFHQEFALVVPGTVEELVKHPFNGANFSSRLWKQKSHMVQRLNESMTTMLVQGRAPKTLAEDFSKAFGTKEYEAYRLLQTESAFMMEQGTLAAYKADEVKKYEFLATLDGKTSEICRDTDGEIYDVEKAVTGVNFPPMHVFCRSTTVPYYEDGIGGTRVARDPETGKTVKVSADMTYHKWSKNYVGDTT